MNFDQQRLVRIRRAHTVAQSLIAVAMIAVLAFNADDLLSTVRSQQEFRKQFHAHLVDLSRGQGSIGGHAEFYAAGSKAQISLDRAFRWCLAAVVAAVFLWIGMGALLHQRSAMILEGMPEQSGALRVLYRLGTAWAAFFALLEAAALINATAILAYWESIPYSGSDALASAYTQALSASQTVRTLFTIGITTAALSFVFGLIAYLQGAWLMLSAGRQARLRQLERDVLAPPDA